MRNFAPIFALKLLRTNHLRMKIKAVILPALAVVLAFTSCSKFNQIIKTNDLEVIYSGALDYYKQKKDDKALTLFNLIEPYYRMSSREDTIAFYSAVSTFRIGKDFMESSRMFNEFKRNFPRSPFLEEAEYLSAMGYYYASPAPYRDATATRMAIMSFSEYISRYPNSIKREECEEYILELTQKLYDKELINAKVYYDLELYKSAIHALKTSLSDFPNTNHREEMLYLITKSCYLLADNSITSLQRSRYLDMVDAYYNLISEFPDTKYLKEVTRMYQTVQGRLKNSGGDVEAVIEAEEEPA